MHNIWSVICLQLIQWLVSIHNAEARVVFNDRPALQYQMMAKPQNRQQGLTRVNALGLSFPRWQDSGVNTVTAQSFRKAQNINEQHFPQELNHALCSETELSREADGKALFLS